MPGSNIVLFRKVRVQIVKLHGGVAFVDIGYYTFPWAHAHSFVANVRVGILPVEIVMAALT